MTVETWLRQRLFRACMWEDQIDEVFKRLRADEDLAECLPKEWEEYPEALRAIFWLTASDEAIAWLREHKPHAISIALLGGTP